MKKIMIAEKTKNEWLVKIEKAIDEFKDYFIERYFGGNLDASWVGNIKAGVLSVGDYFLDFEDLLDFVRYDYSEDEVYEYLEYRLEQIETIGEKDIIINIKNWKKELK